MTSLVFVFWCWWILAVVFLVIELLAPMFFFLWMAVAATITGLIAWIVPAISTEIQILVFSMLSIISIFVWRIYGKKLQIQSDQPLLNKRGAQYVGRVFSLHEPIVNGQGKIKVDDSIWKVTGEDCPINAQVKVTACLGTVFTVEKVI